MKLIFNAFWRAVVYCLHPRVIALSILPLVLMAGLAFALGFFFWDAALDVVRAWLEESPVVTTLTAWFERFGLSKLRSVLAPLIVIFTVTPLLVLVCLLGVSVLMTPSLTALVAEKRFPALERKQGGTFLMGLFWSLGSTLLALIALVISLPLWLVPPLILIVPPLIWGWLTYRVIAFDVLADHASAEERRALFKRYRGPLLAIGVISGYLGAAPSLLWASGAMIAVIFVILVPVAIWLYTLVFAFSSLWFAHFALAALEALRKEKTQAEAALPPTIIVDPVPVVPKPSLPHEPSTLKSIGP